MRVDLHYRQAAQVVAVLGGRVDEWWSQAVFASDSDHKPTVAGQFPNVGFDSIQIGIGGLVGLWMDRRGGEVAQAFEIEVELVIP